MSLTKTFQQLADEAKGRIREVTTSDADRMLQDEGTPLIVIDVREQDEYRDGHIPGARGIGRGILEYHIADEVPDTHAKILLYCRGGNRSALAAASLQEMGYTNVHSMTGGYRKWNEEGRPESLEGEPIVH